jgi:hypothetical protein
MDNFSCSRRRQHRTSPARPKPIASVFSGNRAGACVPAGTAGVLGGVSVTDMGPCAFGQPDDGVRYADMGRCIFTDWSSPMATQFANIDDPP